MRGPHLINSGSVARSLVPHGGTIPVLNIRAPSEGMANDHNIISSLIEDSPSFVRDGNLAEYDAGLECKRIDSMNGLPVDERSVVGHVAQRGHILGILDGFRMEEMAQ